MNPPNPPQSGMPVTADWGRAICDYIRRLRLMAGPGIALNQTPEGTTVSAPAPDLPPEPKHMFLDARWNASLGTSGEWEVWIPENTNIPYVDGSPPVFRNGILIPPEQRYLSESGWVPTSHPQKTLNLCLKSDGSSGCWWLGQGAEWMLGGRGSPGSQVVEVARMLDDGTVVQLHRGAVSSFYTEPDAYYLDNGTFPYHRSVDWSRAPGILELYGFSDFETISAYELGSDTHIVLRKLFGGGGGEVQYVAWADMLSEIVSEVIPEIPPSDPDPYDLSEHPCNEDGTVYVWDPCEKEFVRKNVTDPYGMEDWPCVAGTVVVWDPCLPGFTSKTFVVPDDLDNYYSKDNYEEAVLEYKDHDGVNQTMTVLKKKTV